MPERDHWRSLETDGEHKRRTYRDSQKLRMDKLVQNKEQEKGDLDYGQYLALALVVKYKTKEAARAAIGGIKMRTFQNWLRGTQAMSKACQIQAERKLAERT